MMLGGQLKVVVLNKSYLNHDFILRVPHLHRGTIVMVHMSVLEPVLF